MRYLHIWFMLLHPTLRTSPESRQTHFENQVSILGNTQEGSWLGNCHVPSVSLIYGTSFNDSCPSSVPLSFALGPRNSKQYIVRVWKWCLYVPVYTPTYDHMYQPKEIIHQWIWVFSLKCSVYLNKWDGEVAKSHSFTHVVHPKCNTNSATKDAAWHCDTQQCHECADQPLGGSTFMCYTIAIHSLTNIS